jgi:energy-coupling factor transporter ATP-binding protein EcfA2
VGVNLVIVSRQSGSWRSTLPVVRDGRDANVVALQGAQRGQHLLTETVACDVSGSGKTRQEGCMAGALPQESGLFSLVEMETADETVVVAVPMTTEIRGRTRRDSAEWAKEVFIQHRKNTKIVRTQLKLSNVPIILTLNQDVPRQQP